MKIMEMVLNWKSSEANFEVAIQSLFFSQANAPFLVERHSGDEFDKLEPDSNLFTKLIEEYTPSSYKYTPSSYKVPWIVIDNSSGSC